MGIKILLLSSSLVCLLRLLGRICDRVCHAKLPSIPYRNAFSRRDTLLSIKLRMLIGYNSDFLIKIFDFNIDVVIDLTN